MTDARLRESIKLLEGMAERVLYLRKKSGFTRPIVIEFCGVPKSGKSTCVASLNIFLRRNGFETALLTERASVCPISDKHQPFFNVWTACSTIAELVKNLEGSHNGVDVVLADRAVFDAVCWFEWHHSNSVSSPHFTEVDYDKVMGFLTTPMLTQVVDLVYLFRADVDIAIQREYAYLLTEKAGSIMNTDVLRGYLEAVDAAKSKYGACFQRIEEIDTTDRDLGEVGYEVTLTVLNRLQEVHAEHVGYFHESLRLELHLGVNDWRNIEGWELHFDDRDQVEASNSIQPIAICVITNPERDRVLVLKKRPSKTNASSPEVGKILLYAGGHIRREDERNTLLGTLQNGLTREIQEELGESISVQKDPILIYVPDSEKSKRHLAVCFEVIMDLKGKAFNPNEAEFMHKCSTGISGHVVSLDELVEEYGPQDFDSWSLEILREVFHRSMETARI